MKIRHLLLAVGAVTASVGLFVGTGMPTKLDTMASLYREDGVAAVYYRAKTYIPGAGPNVHWETTDPESVGMSGGRLAALRDSLEGLGTRSLIVAKNGRIVLEWYAPGSGPNSKQPLAAMAKGVAGVPILLAAVSDGMIGLDDRVASHVPMWEGDPQRSKITVRHLASHSSGIADVDFNQAQVGWRAEYLDHPERRFGMALETAPVTFSPGSRTSYSGVGFYVLAYTLGRVLAHSEHPTDLRSFFRDRVMGPIGVPTEDWILSYEDSYEVDGMTLRAIGSGASYTARAIARVGELLLREGEWEGRQVIRADLVRQALSYAHSPPEPDSTWHEPPPGLGWWVNSEGFFASLPRDAAVAFGSDGQIVLLVPSLHLLAVRLGGPLSETEDDYWMVAEREVLAPVFGAVEGYPARGPAE